MENPLGSVNDNWQIVEPMRNEGGAFGWLCRCECGATTFITDADWAASDLPPCTCYTHRKKTHGHASNGVITPTYSTWMGMLNRCRDPNAVGYPHYGGRGIAVCERWLQFGNFLQDMGERPDGHWLERRNNDGNYEPANCYWATPKEQARNKRNNVMLTHDDKTQCVAAWAEEAGLPYAVLYRRIKAGWSVADALSTPTGKQGRHGASEEEV